MRKLMAMLLSVIIILLLAYTTQIKASDTTTIYPTTMTVKEINDDLVTCEDYNGYTWSWEGIEDWMVGDTVSAIMYTNGTPIICDDEIVMTRYSGR